MFTCKNRGMIKENLTDLDQEAYNFEQNLMTKVLTNNFRHPSSSSHHLNTGNEEIQTFFPQNLTVIFI